MPVGRGVFIDHGTGLVVGETAVIGNNVSILQEVTLGGTGKEHGDRHPKVRDGVLISAGAKVLGNIILGAGCKVGAGSVVLKDVPACATVVGVPAKVVGWCSGPFPALDMDQACRSRTTASELKICPRPNSLPASILPGFQPRSVSALPTTLTELSAIAAPASTGLSSPNAASGMPTTL